MSDLCKKSGLIVLVLVLVLGVLLGTRLSEPAWGVQGGKGGPGGGGPRYSVVETQGYNLIVTDNHTNILHFYTIDKDEEIGAPLKLRGTVDLNRVGADVIKPVRAKDKKK
ncbi:MAG: hypothetical protein L0Z62_39800 [Gemmataceae bacterium]|nr:hypothetical protein [Gemmataceae bacterium]